MSSSSDKKNSCLQKLVSGGQTGVDRAALDVALAMDFPHGGWCPLGRRAEDGVIPDRYQLKETDSENYAIRTEANVRDSNGTLILTRGQPDGGTALTAKLARKQGKPCLIIDFNYLEVPREVLAWINENGIAFLNVAGPRATSQFGIYEEAYLFLEAVLRLHLG